jgi:hypothetical protein
MLDEVYRLERAAWAGNEAVSMWNHRLLQENSQLRNGVNISRERTTALEDL